MKKGFTLIELLVIVAIAGILFSLISVSLSESKEMSDIKEKCSQFGSKKVSDLPVECYKYYQITK